MAYGSIGTGLQTPPVQLESSMNAITQKYIVPILGDSVFLPSPTFWALQRKGKHFMGGEIVYPIVGMEEMTGGAYYGDMLLQTTVVDSVTPANQVWRGYYQSISLPVFDIILNKGNTGVFDLVQMKFEIASSSLLQKLSRALWHTAPQNTPNDIDDINSWIGTTGNTIAGINRGANPFWNPTGPFSGQGTSTALNVATAEQAYNNLMFGYDQPDTMLMGPNSYAGFKDNFIPENRFFNEYQDTEAVQAGFRYHFMYNNMIVLNDMFTPAHTAWMLNSKYIFPVFHEEDYFTVDPWVKPSNQRVVVSQVYLTWQLMCTSPRMNAVITNIL